MVIFGHIAYLWGVKMEDKMSRKQVDQAFNVKEIIAGTVDFMVSGFLMDCRARNLSPNTIRIYTVELSYFLTFLDQQGVVKESELTPEVVLFKPQADHA